MSYTRLGVRWFGFRIQDIFAIRRLCEHRCGLPHGAEQGRENVARKPKSERGRKITHRIILWLRSSINCLFLPNAQAEPRPYMARVVLLGARTVTCMVVGSSAWFGVLVLFLRELVTRFIRTWLGFGLGSFEQASPRQVRNNVF